jgi:2-phosphoglycerate kinase
VRDVGYAQIEIHQRHIVGDRKDRIAGTGVVSEPSNEVLRHSWHIRSLSHDLVHQAKAAGTAAIDNQKGNIRLEVTLAAVAKRSKKPAAEIRFSGSE